MLVMVLEVSKRRLPAAASRDAAADSVRLNRSSSLLHGDAAIALSRCSNCCVAMQQSTSQHISGNKTNEMKSLK